jgi:hypothetical protein
MVPRLRVWLQETSVDQDFMLALVQVSSCRALHLSPQGQPQTAAPQSPKSLMS